MGKVNEQSVDDPRTGIEEVTRASLEGLGIQSEQWLDDPNAHLGGRTPRAAITDGEEETVRDLLWSIRAGDLS